MSNGITAPGPCARCGRNPALGFASMSAGDGPMLWYCHTDDPDAGDCYTAAWSQATHVRAQAWSYDPPPTTRWFPRLVAWLKARGAT